MLGITTSATADITFVVQSFRAGTTVWTEIVAKELEPPRMKRLILKCFRMHVTSRFNAPTNYALMTNSLWCPWR